VTSARDERGGPLRRGTWGGALVLGLTGPNASGKGEVARLLRERGFAYHSLSDIIREEAVSRGLTTGRDHLIATGNDMRERGGPGFLAERMLPRLGGRDLVDSVRNPVEVEVLRRLPRFVLLGVTAPIEVRYRRALGRPGRGDATESLDAFAAKEAEENTSQVTAQRLDATFALADRILMNDAGLPELERKIDALLAELEGGPG
jgi:dephospho-CoA kinase